MKRIRLLSAAAALSVLAPSLWADITLPEIFNSHMVLQRNVKLPVWGNASPGEKVSVSFNGQEKTAQADQQGQWKLELDPVPAGGPFQMTVKGNNQITLVDVLVGEVWLCSGQSNMEWGLGGVDNGAREVAAANYPNIRLFHVQKDWQGMPIARFNLPVEWKPCTPANVPAFSAVGYFFGRELSKKLNVPIGLINSSWGGTRIEPWTPPVGFKQVPALKDIVTFLDQKDPSSPVHKELALKVANEYRAWAEQTVTNVNTGKTLTNPPGCPDVILPFRDCQQPTVLFNGMINPLVPFAICGAIWYQGESNLDEGMVYAEKMKALIQGWRTVFNNPDMPFYFAQLAPFNYQNDPAIGARLWEAQSWVAKNVSNTGMAVINDIGNLNDIHPRNKQDVGLRLANLALKRTYKLDYMAAEFPVFKGMKIDGNRMKIALDNAQGLKTRDGKTPNWFEICTVDGIFKPADAVIEGESIILSANGVAAPVAMRFAWSIVAEPNLVNGNNLPAASFRAGEIPVRGDLDQLVPEAKEYQLVCAIDPTKPQMMENNFNITYTIDRRTEITGEIVSIAYFLKLYRNNSAEFVFVSMDPFTKDMKKIGVPVKSINDRFQMQVRNLFVKSNVQGVANGTFADGGNIEFWDCNYSPANAANIPNASSDTLDFGDQMDTGASPGYGCMQVHNFAQKQTVFAFNKWQGGGNADLGIGNSPVGNPDWTFRDNAKEYQNGILLVLVKTK